MANFSVTTLFLNTRVRPRTHLEHAPGPDLTVRGGSAATDVRLWACLSLQRLWEPQRAWISCMRESAEVVEKEVEEEEEEEERPSSGLKQLQIIDDPTSN